MIAAALSLSLLTGLLPHHSATAPSVQRARVDGWTYEVRTDSFTGAKACKLYARDRRTGVIMTYVPGAVAFRLTYGVDTSAAVYRIDGGAPHKASDDETSLVERHVVMPNPVLNQGTQGLVFIPDAVVTGAKQVSIRANPGVRPTTVALGGFDRALTLAQAQGCAPETFAQLDIAE